MARLEPGVPRLGLRNPPRPATIPTRLPVLALPLLLVLAAGATWDLHRVEKGTIVIYTTSALQDFLENGAIPAFAKATGIRVAAVYLAAGDEYYRVRLSPDRPEADLFLHASPLYLEKGYADGLFEPFQAPTTLAVGNVSREVPGGHVWAAFAWSPLVEVYNPDLGSPPDLATTSERLGLAHPRLSNNGVYTTLMFEAVDPAAGGHAVAQTVVQPTNARATIDGVAQHSYAATVGYEAVASFFEGRGAKIAYAMPVVGGARVSTPVLMSVALVNHHAHSGAQQFIDFLFANSTQHDLARFGLRSVDPGVPDPAKALPLLGVRMVRYDWATWAQLEAALPRYEVNG